MSERVSEDFAARGTASNEPVSLADDLLWGVKAISDEINRSERQTFHLLENGHLPAKKKGGRWCASRAGLRRHFAELLSGEMA
jgi:hypothetical protein